MRSPDSLSDIEKARLADFSEARAYAALVECAQELNDPTFRTARIGSALALCSDTVKSSVIFNRVIGLGLFEDASEQMLDEAAGLYAESRVPWGVEVSAVTCPERVVEWLKKRRMRRGLATAMLIRSCANVPDIETDIRIERVGPEAGKICAAISAPIFRVAPEIQALLEVVSSKMQYRQWLAYDGNVPVASCLSFIQEGVVWSGWSATLPSHRGRRIHAAFVAACMRDAAEAGCEWFTAETAIGTPDQPDPAYRNLLRLGFSLAYERYTYISMPR